MKFRSWLIFLSCVLTSSLAANDCMCEDGSFPYNYRDIAEWQNTNDPAKPLAAPPKVDCQSSKPGKDCPNPEVKPSENKDTDVIKKNQCTVMVKQDGKPTDLDVSGKRGDADDCKTKCADEIKRETDKHHATGAKCRWDEKNFVMEGAYKRFMGDCICNPTTDLKIVGALVDIFLEALPLIGKVIKEVWTQAFELVLTLPLNGIPGIGGALGAAVTSTVAAAKLCEYTYTGIAAGKAFVQWGKGAGNLGKDILKTFEKAKDRPDQDFKPPKDLPKGSGKDGDKGAPKDWDKNEDGSDAIRKNDKKDDRKKDCDKKKDEDCDKDDKTSAKPSQKVTTSDPVPAKPTSGREPEKSTVTSKDKTRSPSPIPTPTKSASLSSGAPSSGSADPTRKTDSLSTSRSTRVSSTTSAQPCSPSCASCDDKTKKPPKVPRRGLVELATIGETVKRTLKSPGLEHGDPDFFVTSEVMSAEQLDIHSTVGHGSSTAMARAFGNLAYKGAVTGLYGCTSVIIPSKGGVWISHFWEGPSFRLFDDGYDGRRRPQDAARFRSDVISQLQNGGPSTAKMPRVQQFVGPGSAFHESQEPQWIIMTPRERGGFPGRLRYSEEVREIREVLQRLIPSVRESNIVDYVTKGDSVNQQLTSSGKALFQYDPVQEVIINPQDSCKVWQKAKFRLWIEDHPQSIMEKDWRAGQHQIIEHLGQNALVRKPDGSCEKRAQQPSALFIPPNMSPVIMKLEAGQAPTWGNEQWIPYSQ